MRQVEYVACVEEIMVGKTWRKIPRGKFGYRWDGKIKSEVVDQIVLAQNIIQWLQFFYN